MFFGLSPFLFPPFGCNLLPSTVSYFLTVSLFLPHWGLFLGYHFECYSFVLNSVCWFLGRRLAVDFHGNCFLFFFLFLLCVYYGAFGPCSAG